MGENKKTIQMLHRLHMYVCMGGWMDTLNTKKLYKNKNPLYILNWDFWNEGQRKKQTAAQWKCPQQNPSFPPNYIWTTA